MHPPIHTRTQYVYICILCVVYGNVIMRTNADIQTIMILAGTRSKSGQDHNAMLYMMMYSMRYVLYVPVYIYVYIMMRLNKLFFVSIYNSNDNTCISSTGS
jgi:hypothetical protein